MKEEEVLQKKKGRGGRRRSRWKRREGVGFEEDELRAFLSFPVGLRWRGVF